MAYLFVGIMLLLASTTMMLFPLLGAPSPLHAHTTRFGVPVFALYNTAYEIGNWDEAGMPDIPSPRYSGGDNDTMRRHILQASDAGITALVCLWQGPEEKIRNGRCKRLQRRMIEIGKGTSRAVPMSIALMIDLGSKDNPKIRTQSGLEHALHKLWKESIDIGNSHYLRFAGKPAIFWLNPNYYGEVTEWQTLRHKVDPGNAQFWFATTDIPNFRDDLFEYLDVFDAVFFYDLTLEPTPAAAHARIHQLVQQYNQVHGSQKPFIATVMPGYDNRWRYGEQGHARDREYGAYYRQTWESFVPYAPAAIFLNSFNGFHEGTAIEPGEKTGDHYLKLTRSLIDEFIGLPPTPTAQAGMTDATKMPTSAADAASASPASSPSSPSPTVAAGIYFSPTDPAELLDRINRGIPTARVYYQGVAPGTVQGFEAWHYAPGEQVSLWFNLPDGKTTRALPYRAVANEQGYVLIGFQTQRIDPEGVWSLVGQGLQSGRVIVAPFWLHW